MKQQQEPRNNEGWFRADLKKHQWRFLLIIVLATLTLLAGSALMFTSGYLISKSALQPENILMVYIPVVLVRTFGIGRSVLQYLEKLMAHDTVLRMLAQMRVKLYTLLEPQALFIRSRFRTGDVLGVVAEDIEQLQHVYLRTIFPTAAAMVMFMIGTIVLGSFDFYFALLMALHMAILLFVFPLVSLVVTKRKHLASKTQRAALYQKLTDAVLGLGDWVISGRSRQFVEEYEADEAALARIERGLHRWSRIRVFLSQIVIASVVVWALNWSSSQADSGVFDPVWIAAFVLVVFPWMDVFVPITDAVDRIPRYQDSWQRLEEIRKSKEAHDAVGASSGDKGSELYSPQDLHKLSKPDLELHQVRFQYSSSQAGEQPKWALHDIELSLPHGKKLAVLGRSGAGKSTLLQLIQGSLVPQSGTIQLGGASPFQLGKEMSAMISVLNQQPHLFDTTIANNIRLGKPDATDEEVERVARQVKLDKLIAGLPEGYQTPMLETGLRFSGGERQRIALARVLLQDTPIVILDEPTIGLDPRTEQALLRTIFETTKDKTLIWITHHLIGVEKMDEIIFLEDGQVRMRGTHEQLLEREERYRKLYALDRPSYGVIKFSPVR